MQPIKITPAFFTEVEQTILKFVQDQKRPLIAKVMLKKKTKAGGITILGFSLYYKAVIKTVWYWHKNRHIDQWNRIENPELDPETYGQQIFNNAVKSIQWKKDNPFSKWCWENWAPACRKMKVNYLLTAYIKLNSIWVKDPNVGQETTKILQEKTRNSLFDLSHSNFLLDLSLEARERKAKMNYWDLIKTKAPAQPKKQPTKLKGN